MIDFVITADTWFENLMLTIRTPWGLNVSELVTFFGNATTVVGIAGLIGAYLVYSNYHLYKAYVLGLAVSLLGAAASSYFLKEIVQRARPSGLLPTITDTSHYSFPSWHATGAVAFYGFIAFLLCRRYPERARGITVLASLIIISIGASRLYLGVHFPSDVIAGFALGGLWLYIGYFFANKKATH